jgi:hypothetical protein
MATHRDPSPAAEQRWRAEEMRFRQRMNVTALITAAGMVLTYIAASHELQPLAILSFVAVVGAMARIIQLIVERRRTFFRIMMDDGLTRDEALWQDLRRHGG